MSLDRTKHEPTPRRLPRLNLQAAVHPGAYMIRVAGGCDSCDAYQQIPAAFLTGEPGLWIAAIYHDDDCPFLARHEGRAS